MEGETPAARSATSKARFGKLGFKSVSIDSRGEGTSRGDENGRASRYQLSMIQMQQVFWGEYHRLMGLRL